MRAHTPSLVIAAAILTLGVGSGAQAGTAMFQASFIVHAFGKIGTTGTEAPSGTFTAIPLGYDCSGSVNGSTPMMPSYPRCGQSTLQAGKPEARGRRHPSHFRSLPSGSLPRDIWRRSKAISLLPADSIGDTPHGTPPRPS